MNKTRMIGGGILGVFVVLIFFMTYFTVDQNERTVVTRFGELQYVAEPGLNFKIPFVNGTQSFRVDLLALSPDAGVNTYTVDNQEVDVVFTVFYRIPVDRVAYIYTNNRDYKARLSSLALDRLKAAMGQVNVQVVAEKRGLLRDSIKDTLTRDAVALGVEVVDFQLSDLQYTKSFRDAVGLAAVQKAGIETRDYERQQAEKTALTVRLKAEGEANAVRAAASGAADARVMQANAEAGAIKVQGEAQATAIKAQADALKANPDLVNLRRAERWDGKLPSSIYGSAPIPFLNAQ